MLEIATKNLGSIDNVELTKIDGVHIPYPDRSVDVSFTVTVLQHDTDETMFSSLVRELCRVTRTTIVVMEGIGPNATRGGAGDYVGRKIDVYESVFGEHGFGLAECQFLNTKISRSWFLWVSALYRRFSRKHREEGDPIDGALELLIALPMPLTRLLDNVIVEEQDLAKMIFQRV